MQIYTKKYHLEMQIWYKGKYMNHTYVEIENCDMKFNLYPTDPIGTNNMNITVQSQLKYTKI